MTSHARLPAGHAASTIDGRWFATGSSTSGDARTAGAESTRAALVGTDAALLVVLATSAHDPDELLAGVAEVAGDVPVIGCTTAGEISSGGPTDGGVVVAALGGPGFTVATAAGVADGASLRDAAALVASNAPLPSDGRRGHEVLVLLSDGLCGDQQEVVRGAYSVVGAGVPLVGGCAGDDLRMKSTTQFHGRHALQRSVVGAAIASSGPLGIGVQHGWRKVGEPMLVTAAGDNRVRSLDDRPALDAYLDALDAPAWARTPEGFTNYAITHPLGLSRRKGEEVRFVAEADFEDRSLGCIAEVPNGALVWLMEGDQESVLSAVDRAADEAIAQLGGRPVLGAIAFDCIARRGILEDGIASEVERLRERVGGAPVCGFYTYGEIARVSGVNGFHNQTLVVLAFG